MSNKALTLVATYRHTIHASLERIWENDWEHLPQLQRRKKKPAVALMSAFTMPSLFSLAAQ